MKILFVGSIFRSYVNTTRMRMRVIEESGHEVSPLCVDPFHGWGGRWGGALFRRWAWGPPLWRLNHAVLKQAAATKPDLVWIDKGPWITAATLRQLRTIGDPFLLHYTPDPAIVFHRSRHFLRAIREYDLLITTKRYELDLYREQGARELHLGDSGFDLLAHRPLELSSDERRRYGCDVVFIGTYSPGRERYLRPLAEAGVDLAIWGNHWREACRDPVLLRCYRGAPLLGDDYARGLSAAKIGLGLLTPLVPDRSTTRSFEIPASGTFLLAERTEEHEELFRPGHEAEFFDCETELIDKVNHYLAHPKERERIAAAGRKRCLEGGFSYHDQVATILEKVKVFGDPAKNSAFPLSQEGGREGGRGGQGVRVREGRG